MKPIKTYLLLSFCTIFLLGSCKSDAEKDAEPSESSGTEVVNSGVALSTETVSSGQRLSKNALATYTPENILDYSKSGEAASRAGKPNERNGGVHDRFQQYYRSKDGKSNLTVTITDYVDNQNVINGFSSDITSQEIDNTTFTSKSFATKEKWLVVENSYYRINEKGERDYADKNSVSIRNPRFSIELEAASTSGSKVPSPAKLLAIFRDSQLKQLLALPIPQGEVIEKEVVDNRIDLDCDAILPIEAIESVCGEGEIKVVATSFEKEKNCNRKYTYVQSDRGVVFIVSQYNDAVTARKAVQVKIDDDDLSSEKVSNVGALSCLVRVGENLFLSVAHKNYLVEIRSFKYNSGNTGACCDCHSKEKLIGVAKEVLKNL